MRAVGGCDCLLKVGVIPRVDNTGPFDPRSKGFGHDLPQLRHEWPLDILLLATREHNRYVQNVRGLRQRQRMTLHHLQGKGLDPLHGADLMVDQEQRRVFSCEEVSHIFSSWLRGSASFSQSRCIFVPEHLRLQAVWVTEEHTQLGAEVRNGAIRRPQLYQAYTDVFEGLPTVGIQTKMVYASTPKHWGLDTRLGIARHLEHIRHYRK